MTKTLEVIKPFLMMDIGDTFEKTKNGTYCSEYCSEDNASTGTEEFDSIYKTSFEISNDYAKSLIASGHLKEISEKKNRFINVFDEIDRLNALYKSELSTLDEEYAEMPTCLKVEKMTVLDNLTKVLDYLSNLKK